MCEVKFGCLKVWLTDADKQRQEDISQDRDRMDQFLDWIMKMERKDDVPTLSAGGASQDKSGDMVRMMEIKLDASNMVAQEIE